jgi:hypothetical protein
MWTIDEVASPRPGWNGELIKDIILRDGVVEKLDRMVYRGYLNSTARDTLTF